MRRVMSKRAVATIRRTVNDSMPDVIEIWRPSTSSLDEDTLVEHNIPGEKIYEGPARISPTRGPKEQPVGEGVLALRDADFLMPHDGPLPYRDDEVKAKVSADPALQDRWFKITDVRVFSQQASRRFSGVQAQPSRLWDLDTAGEGDGDEAQ